MTEIENLYSVLGGKFISAASDIRNRLQHIKIFAFDWDGVFNSGEKTSATGSTFSEVDSMGVNLLRYSFFLKYQHHPVAIILSGEKNETAFHYSEREGFTGSYYKIPHKIEALNHICGVHNVDPSQVAYFFDDILDIPLAEKCGLRIQVNQGINPLFIKYCIKNRLVDYLTANRGGSFAVREACELLIGLNENYDEVINGRKNNADSYQKYIALRKEIKPEFFTLQDSGILKIQRN